MLAFYNISQPKSNKLFFFALNYVCSGNGLAPLHGCFFDKLWKYLYED